MKHERETILCASGLRLTFGGVSVLHDVSFAAHRRELVAIVGPNGAGKTSLLNCLSGFYHPEAGEIQFLDKDITRVSSHVRTTLGVGRTFQKAELYGGLTVLDNVMAGRHCRMRANPIQCMLYWPWAHREDIKHRRRAEEILDFLDLEPVRHKAVGELGYGLRKRVDLARALATEPQVMLMDEPMAGMSIEEKQDMARFILEMQATLGLAIVLIEHDLEVVGDIADRVVAMAVGSVIAEGEPSAVMRDPKVIESYIGSGFEVSVGAADG